jgi:hypothetical protein
LRGAKLYFFPRFNHSYLHVYILREKYKKAS